MGITGTSFLRSSAGLRELGAHSEGGTQFRYGLHGLDRRRAMPYHAMSCHVMSCHANHIHLALPLCLSASLPLCLSAPLPHVHRVEAAGKVLDLWRENALPRRIPTHMHVSGSGHQRVPLKHMLGCPLFLQSARWEATRQAYRSLSCRAGLSNAAMGPNVSAPLSRVMNTLRLPCPCPAPPACRPTNTHNYLHEAKAATDFVCKGYKVLPSSHMVEPACWRARRPLPSLPKHLAMAMRE